MLSAVTAHRPHPRRGQGQPQQSGGLQRSSGLHLFDVTVNGVTVGLSDKGFSSGSNSSPLPADPMAEQLAKAGISVTYLAAREVPDGVMSPGWRIQIDNEQSDLHTVMVVGQALAVASATRGGQRPARWRPARWRHAGLVRRLLGRCGTGCLVGFHAVDRARR